MPSRLSIEGLSNLLGALNGKTKWIVAALTIAGTAMAFAGTIHKFVGMPDTLSHHDSTFAEFAREKRIHDDSIVALLRMQVCLQVTPKSEWTLGCLAPRVH